eukprot:11955-Heterococcus_DN1.PRE.4
MPLEVPDRLCAAVHSCSDCNLEVSASIACMNFAAHKRQQHAEQPHKGIAAAAQQQQQQQRCGVRQQDSLRRKFTLAPSCRSQLSEQQLSLARR